LLDPYARLIGRDVTWHDSLFAYQLGKDDSTFDKRDSAPYAPLAQVVDTAFTWGDDRPPRTPWHKTFIYEVHVRGFTKKHPNIPESMRGAYIGLASDASIQHLRDLHVTAVELLPVHYHLDDRHLTRLAKSIRHDLTAALSVFGSDVRHAARETRADVGTSLSVPSESQRSNLSAVLAASFKRVEQSLRSLEEYSKTVSTQTAAALEQLRYRVYTLERVTDITQASLEQLADAQLYVLIDGGRSESQLRGLVKSLVAAGAGVIQLRDKHLPDRELLARARVVRDATADTDTLFIMNDRPDLALLSGADGVHVGQDELTVKDVRRILGTRGLIGVSTHSLQQAHAAVLDGADYLGVGPTFPSGTKQFSEFTGVELLRSVAEEISLPAFAIGGINARNLPEVLAAGFTRIAVSGAVTTAADPATAARELAERLRG